MASTVWRAPVDPGADLDISAALTITFREFVGRLRSRPAAFQMLFRVGDIAHDPRTGSRARTREPAENAIALPDGDQARRTAAQPLKRKLA